jgi:hypothetical protein
MRCCAVPYSSCATAKRAACGMQMHPAHLERAPSILSTHARGAHLCGYPPQQKVQCRPTRCCIATVTLTMITAQAAVAARQHKAAALFPFSWEQERRQGSGTEGAKHSWHNTATRQMSKHPSAHGRHTLWALHTDCAATIAMRCCKLELCMLPQHSMLTKINASPQPVNHLLIWQAILPQPQLMHQ